MEDVLIARNIVEELERKIFNSESVLRKNLLEVYMVENVEDQILFIFQKRRSKKNSMGGRFFLYTPESIIKLLGKVYKEAKKPYVIEIEVHTPNPRKTMRNLIKEDRSLRFKLYVTYSHEIAHYLLLRNLIEETRKKIGEMSNYARNLCSYAAERQKCVEFYLGNLFLLNVYSEIYAHSVSLLTILDMSKRNRISMQEAKEFFGKLLHFFFYDGIGFEKYIVNNKLVVTDVGDLKELEHSYASLIISYIIFKKLSEDEIVDLYENFENKINIIEKLFEEIKEYSKLKFFEEVGKLQQI